MRTQRQVVDYSLRKRALLRDLYAGRVGTYEVCDASPYLQSAARFHGDPTDLRCPVCRRENLTYVHYIYGDELKQSAGQARTRAELPVLAMTLGEFQVYVVEVCRGCGWNHLVEQFLLGRDGLAADPSRHRRTRRAATGGGRRCRGGEQPAKARGSTVSAGPAAIGDSSTELAGSKSTYRTSPVISVLCRSGARGPERGTAHGNSVVTRERVTATGRV